ncbi:MAG: MBL fold metallo-hydrolase [Alphaproteobacteria bacterium]|nr:MBL fold metallo-hydrolase [Alphaproteobacteria bacterium]
MTVSLHFHGAAGMVTGSCYRITHPAGQFLVDCGLFQGNKSVRALNDKPMPFDAKTIDYVLVTHAHIDHIGLIPRLYAKGYRGALHHTEPTSGLMEFLLDDAAGIQEYEAERQNKTRARRGEAPVAPLYTLEDAEEALKHRNGHAYEEWVAPGPGVRFRLWNAGHILGSASIEVEVADSNGETVSMLFSGDLGPDEKVFYREPDAPSGFDYILCETTYGGRDRDDYTLEARREALKFEINRALERGGNLVIPAFAVERSQELLHDIGYLIERGEINPSLVFLDSPLARKVTGVYKDYAALFEDVELSAETLFADPRFRIVESVQESKDINKISGGAIIMAASGMCDAGRIKHHLRNNLIRANATVLFVGYQAPGTLGAVIQGGAEEVRIHGDLVPIRAEIRTVSNYSAHADHSELVAWMRDRLPAHGAVFLTHGEDEGREAMRKALWQQGLGSDQVILPLLDDYFELKASGVETKAMPAERRIDMRQTSEDWHNLFADFSIRLSDRLRSAQSDRDRLELMQAVRAALDAGPGPAGGAEKQ